MTYRLIFFLLLIISACSRKNDGGKILPPEKMESVLWDVVEADVFVFTKSQGDSSFNPPRENALLQESIFKSHGVTREEYYRSLDHYMANSEIFIPILDSVMAQHQAVSPKKRRGETWYRDSLRLEVQ